MDERVLRSMARWPDVPAVFGWLSLDARGRWLLQGETISNRAAVAFISRNYTHDSAGRWYFQNGPQRVYVELHAAPWILSLSASGCLRNHIGDALGAVRGACMDEHGSLFLDTGNGLGQVDDRDLERIASDLVDGDGRPLDDDSLEQRLDLLGAGGDARIALRIAGRLLPIEFVARHALPGRFSFVREPRAEEVQNA